MGYNCLFSLIKYIFYMLDNAKEDELRCVLLSDYMDLYPNEVNGIGKVLDIVYKVINYILLAVSFISLFYGIMHVINGVLESISLKISLQIEASFASV